MTQQTAAVIKISQSDYNEFAGNGEGYVTITVLYDGSKTPGTYNITLQSDSKALVTVKPPDCPQPCPRVQLLMAPDAQ